MNELGDVPASMFALINFRSWEIVIKSTIVGSFEIGELGA